MLDKSLADRVNKIREYIVPRDNRECEMVEVITELYRKLESLQADYDNGLPALIRTAGLEAANETIESLIQENAELVTRYDTAQEHSDTIADSIATLTGRLALVEALLPICKKLLVDFETVYNDRARLLKDCAFIKEKPFKDWPDVAAAFEAVKRIEEGTE